MCESPCLKVPKASGEKAIHLVRKLNLFNARAYIEEELSSIKTGEKLGRSSRTTYKHIHQHNKAIERSGFCPKCKRVKSKHEGELAVRK